MSLKVISQAENPILEESFEESENLNISSSESIHPKKKNEKLMIASLDLIEKKKRESFVLNLKLSVKDPRLDISNNEMKSETRSKLEMLKLHRNDFELQIEQKLAIIDNYENEIYRILQKIEKSNEKPEMMETSIKMNTDNNSEKIETASDILKKRREEFQKKKADEQRKESSETKNKLNEFKEKFSSTDINLNKSPNNQISNQESRKESSPSKYDSLQKELNKKLINLLNQQKKDETNILLTDEKNSNKISLKDYQEQIKGKLAPNSEKSIPLPTKDSIIRNQGRKISSKIAERVANLENLFLGKTEGEDHFVISKIQKDENQLIILDHPTFERAGLPRKIKKQSEISLLKKTVSIE